MTDRRMNDTHTTAREKPAAHPGSDKKGGPAGRPPCFVDLTTIINIRENAV
ncbi:MULTISPECIES: hypothetical protein [unclassified Streptosporangium]|uniref:hypothetical protein n=1 Tax=unclassified Streptosporangium TaxID=2632669 RepID=UPI002E2C2A14|nr:MULTISPECIES: hypothetical protein [unclassified Streptosporangium]